MLCAIHIKSNMSAAQCAAMGFVAAPKVQHLFHSKQAQQGGSITFKPPHGASPCQLHWQHFFLVKFSMSKKILQQFLFPKFSNVGRMIRRIG